MASYHVREALEFAKTLRDDQIIDFLTEHADQAVEDQYKIWQQHRRAEEQQCLADLDQLFDLKV